MYATSICESFEVFTRPRKHTAWNKNGRMWMLVSWCENKQSSKGSSNLCVKKKNISYWYNIQYFSLCCQQVPQKYRSNTSTVGVTIIIYIFQNRIAFYSRVNEQQLCSIKSTNKQKSWQTFTEIKQALSKNITQPFINVMTQWL